MEMPIGRENAEFGENYFAVSFGNHHMECDDDNEVDPAIGSRIWRSLDDNQLESTIRSSSRKPGASLPALDGRRRLLVAGLGSDGSNSGWVGTDPACAGADPERSIG